MSQRIGFVDFDLDNFHADVYLKLLRGDCNRVALPWQALRP